VERTILDDEAVQAILTLEDTVETAEFYPFRFKVRVQYWLSYGNLELRYSVLASEKNKARMPFSIGNHITFVTPLVPGSRPGDVVLETPSERELLKTSYGVPTGESRPRSLADGVKLGEFERRTAVSLTGYRNNPFMVLKDPQGLGVRISHSSTSVPEQPVILFNMWGDAPDGFFSPEPWVGLQNSLVMGKGVTYLAPGEVFKWTVCIELLRGE
jgi:galactose mutarotase-like enzyme